MPDILCICGKHLNIPSNAVGRLGKCRFCNQPLRVIAADEVSGELHDRLVIESAPNRVGEQLILGGAGPLEIGKLPGKHILLNAPGVSRAHCRLIRASDGWSIEDQKSTNGVFVNEQRIQKQNLADGDRVRIGEITLLFRSVNHTAPAVLPAASEQEDVAAEPALDADDLYRLSEGDSVEIAPEPPPQRLELMPPVGDGPICPGCKKQLPAGAKICTQCGIDLKTSKSILTAYAADLDAVYTRTESIISVISWIIWTGLYPIASEGFGTRKPYFTWSIAALTVITSVWFWAYEWSRSPAMQEMKNYMLWAGDASPTADQIEFYYWFTSYGDSDAFEEKLEQIENAAGKNARKSELDVVDDPNAVLKAYTALRPAQRCLGEFRPGQLITHAFIHGDLMHLIGNLLFLLVIGSRVNALIGNLATMVIYPLLAAAGGWAYLISAQNQPPHPLIGASGAIMGLAGMYFVLMPLHKVHMAFWYRLGLLFRFELKMKLFALRGFWVVLFYIAFDVAYTIFQVQDNVAHWAHLGGFLAGMGIGFALLLGRLVNCRGGDLLSGLLGRRAWPLIGRPDSTRKSIIASGF